MPKRTQICYKVEINSSYILGVKYQTRLRYSGIHDPCPSALESPWRVDRQTHTDKYKQKGVFYRYDLKKNATKVKEHNTGKLACLMQV